MSDINLKITFPVADPDNYTIDTNAKEDKILEILSEYLRAQMNLGKDLAEPVQRDVYVVEIELDLSNDSFRTRSNTGNRGLDTGIILAVHGIINKKQRGKQDEC